MALGSFCLLNPLPATVPPGCTSGELLVLHPEAALVDWDLADVALRRTLLPTASVEDAQLGDDVQQQEDPGVGDEANANDRVVPLRLSLELRVASQEHGDPHHPDNDGDQHGGKDEPPVLLPVLTRAAEGGLGDKEREGHQEEDIDQETDKVYVELTGCHVHEHRPSRHDEGHVLYGDDDLQQADTDSNEKDCCPAEGDSTADQLHQVGSVSQEAGETDSKENPKEEVADRGGLLVERDDEGKSKSEEPQHTEQEEELCGKHVPLAAVLHPPHEEEDRQEQQYRHHYANHRQGLQNDGPWPLIVTEEVIVFCGLHTVLVHGGLQVDLTGMSAWSPVGEKKR